MGKSKTEIITEYLIETYKPEAIITYGSFGDGSFNENSDFDALVIADHAKYHDASVVDNTVLDVFVYPVETFEEDYDPEEFMQIFDGEIVLDKNGIGEGLKKRINDYIYPEYKRLAGLTNLAFFVVNVSKEKGQYKKTVNFL